MSELLCITFRFIHPFPLFHGRAEADKPEWPPSPLRAYQALLNAASMRGRGRPLDAEVRSVLTMMESITPRIIAPIGQIAKVGYRNYVPHNQADLVTAAWNRGNLDASIASHRMEKDSLPIRITYDEAALPAVHFLYPLELIADDAQRCLSTIRPAARAITALGWGIDQVAADATVLTHSDAALLCGEVWNPTCAGGRRLRIPRTGVLDELTFRHDKFLHRIKDGNFTPVPPITATRIVSYRRDIDPAPRPYAVFKLLDANEDAFRYPHAKLMHIAGMVRHVAIERMRDDPPHWIGDSADWINRVVRGKQDEAASDHYQFSYVPLPSIGHAHADGLIRNVMIVAPPGMERELEYLAERLNGELLTPEDYRPSDENGSLPPTDGPIELQRFTPPAKKFIASCYLGASPTWRTVTPVILPGHNDKKAQKTEKLIQKALQQSGLTAPCEFSWQSAPFLKNCLSAHKYDRDGRHTGYHRPAHLRGLTAVHMQLHFAEPVLGPITLGAGRHCGFGLFAVPL
ncbi:MAG: type I-U CRISPR-associated protein Cas5/Cas6 [Pirellulales bacterium]|nr:type I-U CRISPR-associated protein Cas5/Cas6 [Pirellulales bacterium]